MPDRKKPGWVFWTTLVFVGLPVLYVLSIPLMVAAFQRGWFPSGTALGGADEIYSAPLGWAINNSPPSVQEWLIWYACILGTGP